MVLWGRVAAEAQAEQAGGIPSVFAQCTPYPLQSHGASIGPGTSGLHSVQAELGGKGSRSLPEFNRWET